jgi:hypothetical protein
VFLNLQSFFILADNALIRKVRRQSTVIRNQAKRGNRFTIDQGMIHEPMSNFLGILFFREIVPLEGPPLYIV